MSIDQPDFGFAMLGPNRLPSIWERRSIARNDQDILAPAAPDNWVQGATFKGKFFPRGMRGVIEQFHVYCYRTAAGTMDLCISPHPVMGPLYTITVTPGAAWAWVASVFRQMWNYDSLFIWVNRCDADVYYAFDTLGPYDGRTSADTGATWQAELRRYYFRPEYTGQTAGDVPVSGTLNIIKIPATASERFYKAEALDALETFTFVDLYGAGELLYVMFFLIAGSSSELSLMSIYCDDQVIPSFRWNGFDLNVYGYVATTPGIQLLKYGVGEQIVVQTVLPFNWRRHLEIIINARPAGVYRVEGAANLLR